MNLRTSLLAASLALALSSLVACSSTPPSAAPQAVVTAPAVQAASQPSAAQAAAAAYDFDMDVFHPVVAANGMVASEQELASRIGLDILKAGGNAVDAAVAMGFALAVALPNAGNLGGGGFMMVHDARTGRNVALDFREVAPAAFTRDIYLDTKGNVIDGKSLYTHYAVGVPGTVAGLEHALKKWGTLPLSTVVAPAAALAERGYPVSETLAKILQQEQKNMGKWPATTAIFWKNGAPLQRGDLLVQKDLAQSLRLIGQQGARAFYEGEIAQKIAAEMAPHAGALTLADMGIEAKPLGLFLDKWMLRYRKHGRFGAHLERPAGAQLAADLGGRPRTRVNVPGRRSAAVSPWRAAFRASSGPGWRHRSAGRRFRHRPPSCPACGGAGRAA